jgi:hypothetical protein
MATTPTPQPPPQSPKPASKGTDDAPPKYKRPLPQPGDKDYVAGQPVSDEEADKVEKEVADKAAAKAAADKAAATKKPGE